MMASKADAKYKAIDISVNAFLPESSHKHLGLGLWKASGPAWAEKVRKGWSGEYMVEMMDRGNVELSFLISLCSANGVGGEEIIVPAEEVLAVVQKYPKRFVGLVGISPIHKWGDKYYPPTYIERAIKEYGFKGVHMYPHWYGIRINDRRMYPIFEKCAELDVPISFQTGQGTMRSGSRVVARPIWIDEVVRDFPTLKIVALHSGYPWEDELVAMATVHEHVYICPDVPPPRLWHPAILSYLKEEGRFEGLGGSDKIIWATDFPLQEPRESLAEIDALGLKPETRRKLVRDNAVRLYRLSVED
jgi:predicted TIM-barrel fold metal-dependent hydrolase